MPAPPPADLGWTTIMQQPSANDEHRESPTASLVVLTTGDRPDQLEQALASALEQRGVTWNELLVVFNGVPVQSLPPGVSSTSLVDNVGIPEGRNVGARLTTGDVVVFLDDDARFEQTDILAELIEYFRRERSAGALAFRLVDEHGETAQRHVPRPGGKDPTVSGEVTAFLGGAVAIRRAAFDAAGGYPGEFFYALEETDLSLGMIDAGWSVRYEPRLTVFHPRTDPARHSSYLWRTARNRVLLARRRLPWPIAVLYVFDWFVLTAVRERLALSALKVLAAGSSAGLRFGGLTRRPIRWATVWRLTRIGRPPII